MNGQIDVDRFRRRCWGLLPLAVVAFVLLAPCDVVIARWFYTNESPPSISQFLVVFADVAGGAVAIIVVLLVATVALDRHHLKQLPLLLTMSLGGGLIVDGLKLCICRSRPYTVDLSTATFESTFGGLLPMLSAGSRGQSFPSGHSALAVGFAAALTLLYPRGRWAFAGSAILVMVSRVQQHAHFPTDAVAGAMVTLAWALVCTSQFAGVVFNWFDQRVFSKARIRRAVRNISGEVNPSSISVDQRDIASNRRDAA